ncbi:MAG: DUF1311 domain-containing protein [Acidobacteriia bacterium]|nr:DUF1311 domain-containing protein [Terriglobia bacterium]
MLDLIRLSLFFLLLATISSAGQNSKLGTANKKQENPCGSATTQMQLNQCYGEQYRKVDARLNAVFGNLMRTMQKALTEAVQRNDVDEKKYQESSIQKLNAAENAWVAYRALHCDAARHQVEGGSMSPMAWAACMAATTDDRISELKNAYEDGDFKLE